MSVVKICVFVCTLFSVVCHYSTAGKTSVVQMWHP